MMSWASSTAARTLWQEARGEPLAGKRAVAHVLWNRLRLGRWGKSLGAVCLSRSQFSAWGPVTPRDSGMLANFRASCALRDDDPELLALEKIVADAEKEPDPTGGAVYYYNPKAVAHVPTFVTGDPETGAKPGVFCGRFGNHMFYKEPP